MQTSNSGIDRAALLRQADALLKKSVFTKEDSARTQAIADILRLASTSAETRTETQQSQAELHFKSYLTGRTPRQLTEAERRDVTLTGSPTDDIKNSVLVPENYGAWTVALKATDQILDGSFTRRLGPPFAPMPFPILDPTAIAASVVTEAGQDPAQQDAGLSAVTLGSCPVYRTPMLKISNEALQDSTVADLLVSAMAISQARGIGRDLINNVLLTSAPVALTAAGSSRNTGGSETGGTSIGSGDLIALRTSIDPAYRASARAAWIMSDTTLAALDGLLDKQGSFVFGAPQFDENGYRVLLGYRVCLSPSMPNIGTNQMPVAFGDLSRFAIRMSAVSIARLHERFAEYDVCGFRSWVRAGAALLIPQGGESPIKLLQNAAT